MRGVGAIATASCCVALAACGGDEDGGEAGATTTTTTAAKRGPQVLRANDIPFTFRYPGDFRAVPKAQRPQGFRAIIGLDRLNFLDVRLTSPEPLPDARIERLVRSALGEGVTTESVAREQRGKLRTVRFVVRSTSGGTPLRSQLVFFRAGGRTWELGCQSTDAGRARIDAACEDALGSLRVKG